MTRFVAVGLVVLGSLASAGVARAADNMPLPNQAALKLEKFLVEDKTGGQLIDPKDSDQVRQILNGAHCTCSQADLNTQTFGYNITLSLETGLSRPVDIFVGKNCGDPLRIDQDCLKIDSISSIDSIKINGGAKIRVPLYKAVNVNTMGACNPAISTASVWLMVDRDGDTEYDHWVTEAVPSPYSDKTVKGVDTKSPPLPTKLTALGSEDSIEISWELPSDSTDLFYFQALCTNLDDTQVEDVVVPEQKYQRVGDVCSATDPFMISATDPGTPDEMEVTAPPAAFTTLDPTFLCGQSEMGATNLTISKLKNLTPYKVALVAIDASGNYTATYFSTTVTPRPVIDFWEDLQDRNGAVDGGCLLSTTYGDGNPLTRTLREFRDDTLARSAAGRWLTTAYYATLGKLHVHSLPARIAVGIALLPLVALALAWHLLGLPLLLALLAALGWLGRRRAALLRGRRLRVAAAAAAAAATLGLAPGLAAADEFTPYWEDPSQEQSAIEGTGEVKWNAGIRVGPYTPDIDLQFSQNATTGLGPYEAMFGNYYVDGKKHEQRVWQILPMLDVDRIVWSRFGQIGVGGTIGYMQKSAYAYADGTTEDELMRERSTGSKTTFRLIPLAATVTYRLTYADDRWGVPVIPYVRAGLAYYMWWMKGPSGTSKVCEGGTDDGDMCTDDKAYGGTAGVQLSAGLAIRAERIDTAAARSMRNSGLQHAGFYGEVFWGRVDGFGSDTKLWVGDTTWFAGANFEF
ncbi:MAG TPA: MXAN_2562 family outer membrane beta-barrel protein [Kofleriaceae bacterium]|nr:MXAN_2562 family outer membrane beta-barrel protein [Kofleriaceae bacterium]